MNEKWIRLTRSELHQKVWAAPIKKVAQELGISAPTLANACRKHNIPLPSAGHWTKVELGHKIAPKPLSPELSGNETVQIHIRERLSPELAAVAAEHSPQVPIPQELSHALALRTEKLLASGKENERKLLVPKTGSAAHLLVSRQQLPRALRIMNALFLTLEERGYTVSWPKKEEDRLTVIVEGESVPVSMQEVIDSKPHVLTPAEEKHSWRAPKWDYTLSGRLRLSIDTVPYNSHIRATWADGRVQIVENCIGDFIVGLKVAAAAIKKDRLEREEWNRRWEEERKKKEEQQRRAEEHKRRAEFVNGLIENWEEANRVRTFVMALTEAASQTECSVAKRDEIQQVLDWTTKYADLLDPLADLPGSVEEFVHPELKYPWLKRI
ncbi:MAG: hypothetical protein WA628_27525 [Terriglobales bacterium]